MWGSGLLRFDVGIADHLGPLLGFLRDEPAEIGGRADERRVAELGQLRLDPGIGEACVDLVIEPVDDLGRGVLGRAGTNALASKPAGIRPVSARSGADPSA